MICLHEARGADQLITSAIDAYVQDEQSKNGEVPLGSSPPVSPGNGSLVPRIVFRV